MFFWGVSCKTFYTHYWIMETVLLMNWNLYVFFNEFPERWKLYENSQQCLSVFIDLVDPNQL